CLPAPRDDKQQNHRHEDTQGGEAKHRDLTQPQFGTWVDAAPEDHGEQRFYLEPVNHLFPQGSDGTSSSGWMPNIGINEKNTALSIGLVSFAATSLVCSACWGARFGLVHQNVPRDLHLAMVLRQFLVGVEQCRALRPPFVVAHGDVG